MLYQAIVLILLFFPKLGTAWSGTDDALKFERPATPQFCAQHTLLALVRPKFEKLVKASKEGETISAEIKTAQDFASRKIRLTEITAEICKLIEGIREQLHVIRAVKNVEREVPPELWERLTLLDAFLHDVLTPFNNVNLVLILERQLGSEALVSESDHDPIAIISRGFKHGNEILRTIAAVFQGNLPTFEKSQIDVREALRDVLDLRGIYAEDEVKIFVDLPPQPVWIWGSRVLLTEAVMNLTNNARDAIVKSKKPGVVRVLLIADSHAITISVKDDGPGMAPDFIARAIGGERLTTNAPVGNIQRGVGIGSVMQTLDQHGGSIQVDSSQTTPTGTLFTLELPKTPIVGP